MKILGRIGRLLRFGRVNQLKVNLFILLLFAALMVFSKDDYSIRSKVEYREELTNIEKRILFLRSEIKRDSTVLKRILSSDEYLERYARENLLMCGPKEVIFRINE